MSKLVLRALIALSTALVISCGGGGGSNGGSVGVGAGDVGIGSGTGGSDITARAFGSSLYEGVKVENSPEWGFARQSNAHDGGGDAGGVGSSAGAGVGTGSGTGAGSSSSANGDSASASASVGSGVGSGGTGASASAGDSGDSGVGGVSGVASIIVNGVRYNTAGAVLKLRDAPVLELGMTVKVNGPTNADFSAGEATEVESAVDVRGLVASVDSNSGVLVVLGMTISTDAATVWGNISGVGALAPGMTVQIWGLPAGPGMLRATRVEQTGAGAAPVLSGVVQNLDPPNRRFLLGGMNIDFSRISRTPTFAAGMNVRVRASSPPESGTLQASSVELWYPVSLKEGARRQLGGVVTDFGGVSRFLVLGTPVDASSAQVSGGSAAAIGNGVELDVAGTVSNGVLVATKIKIKKTPGGTSTVSFTAKGSVGSFKSAAEFKVKGQPVNAGGAGVQFVNGTAANLADGKKVSVVGDRIVNDVLIATQVTFD